MSRKRPDIWRPDSDKIICGWPEQLYKKHETWLEVLLLDRFFCGYQYEP